MFNNITIVRNEKDTDREIQRIKVPIIYGPKDKMITRLESDPDLQREIQTILPRMSFEIVSMSYDAERKQNSLLRSSNGANTSVRAISQYMGTPWDINFQLAIYAKNIDDGNQIIEQILPYFAQDYTVTIEPIPQLGFLKDIPIILNSVSDTITYEGTSDTVRYVYWTLDFTLKGYFFGPISTPKIIRKVIANIFNDPSLVTGYVTRMNLGAGNGTFQLMDTVFQGQNMTTATAYGIVTDWNSTNNKITIGATQGQFKVNNTIRAVSTNAKYIISTFDVSPLKLQQITIQPDPLDADPEDDFGYTTTTIEYPDTLDANT